MFKKSCLKDRFAHEKFERKSKTAEKKGFGLPYKYCMKGNFFCYEYDI